MPPKLNLGPNSLNNRVLQKTLTPKDKTTFMKSVLRLKKVDGTPRRSTTDDHDDQFTREVYK
jgi:hypothetical protein